MAATTGGGWTGAEQASEQISSRETAGQEGLSHGSSSEGEISSGEAVEGLPGTGAPLERARTAGKVNTVRELWCARASRAYPSVEAAAREMTGVLEEVWGGRPEISGPPSEMRVVSKGDERFGASVATGLVAVLRRRFDGWERGTIEKLRAKAWPVQASLDECLSVKAFGRVSNHSKEINWLLSAIERFLEAGGVLSKAMEEVRVGYTVLRPHVARDNGSEWSGAVYGVNLSLDELCGVVNWAEGQVKEKMWLLPQELKVEGSGGGKVVSASLVPGAVGYGFKSADHIMGSAMLFVEGPCLTLKLETLTSCLELRSFSARWGKSLSWTSNLTRADSPLGVWLGFESSVRYGTRSCSEKRLRSWLGRRLTCRSRWRMTRRRGQ